MASIENRSKIKVWVKNRPDLTKTFEYNADKAIQAYLAQLKTQGYKPQRESLEDRYAIRARQVGYPNLCLYASSVQEAIEIKERVERERRNGIVIDYGLARRTTFADLMIRYLQEMAPQSKSFETEGYIINARLEDAGLPRQDLAAILAAHPNPHDVWKGKEMRKPTGARMGAPSEAASFIRKSFADVVPSDFRDYIDERQKVVKPATVDRELDVFTAVCTAAIDFWRIPCSMSPMVGVSRPKYCNERDRRLKGNEEERLLNAAHEEDLQKSIALRLEELMCLERHESSEAATTYSRKKIVKEARERYRGEAEQSFKHIPQMETLIQFLLMTGARRSEALSLTWEHVDLEAQTAFLPETKNGRARKLPLRLALVRMLRELPRTNDLVFPIGVDGLRKAWQRICQQAGLIDEHELHLHDLRHEAISRVAEAGSNTPGGFSLVDLQAFSGHRDVRMLLRYANLCATSLAKRLDTAFADPQQVRIHRGRLRLKASAEVSMGDLTAESNEPQSKKPTFLPANIQPAAVTWGNVLYKNIG